MPLPKDFFIADQGVGLCVAELATLSATFSGFFFIGGPGLTCRMGLAPAEAIRLNWRRVTAGAAPAAARPPLRPVTAFIHGEAVTYSDTVVSDAHTEQSNTTSTAGSPSPKSGRPPSSSSPPHHFSGL